MMSPNWLNTDAETFRGKLYLLIFDKVVVGAMIGFTLVAYNIWSTQEQRAYEEQTTLAFQRATYVKELVPIVANTKTDAFVRAEALGALIRTRAIDARSALMLSRQVLRGGLPLSGRPESGFVNRGLHAQDVLVDPLLTFMPSALELLLEQFLADEHDRRPSVTSPEDGRSHIRNMMEVRRFWIDLFYETVERSTDAELFVLDDDQFLAQYLPVLQSIAQRPHYDWSTRNVKGLRLLGCVELLEFTRFSSSPKSPQKRRCIQYLSSLVKAPSSHDAATIALQLISTVQDADCLIANHTEQSLCLGPEFTVEFAAQMIPLIDGCDPTVASTVDAEEALDIPAAAMATLFLGPGSQTKTLSSAAGEYLAAAMGFPEVARDLQPAVAAKVQHFAARVASESSSDLECEEGTPAELLLVAALMNSLSVTPNPAAEEALRQLFSLPPARLDVVGLTQSQSRWRDRAHGQKK
jgi:hypothetical protein